MEESTSPRLFGDPCHLYGHLYSHFLEKQPSTPLSATPSVSSSLSSTHKEPSILVTGFGIRNVESLQRALLDDEQRRQMLLARYDKNEEFEECLSLPSTSSSIFQTKPDKTEFSEVESQTDSATLKSSLLRYLMKLLQTRGEEEDEEKKGVSKMQERGLEIEEEDETEIKMTLAMRKARRYLRQHKIFEFFQFIIAHMLSELPENPIQYIIDLLDKCLLYRSGYGNPPLLYEKAHLQQLFYMMDRMKTGFIEEAQYVTGMRTLGICNYDRKPPLTKEGLVSMETFVEEAYDCLTDLFVEMVRRRGGQETPPSLITPPPTEVKLVSSYVDTGGE